MKLYQKITLFSLVALTFTACDKNDGPDVKDNFLNFDIPKVPVTSDYPVGVYYFNPGTTGQDPVRYGRLSEPSDYLANKAGPYVDLQLGNYAINQDTAQITDEMIDVVQQHVDWCINGGVDFFIMPALRAQRDSVAPNCINQDYRFYDLVLGKNPSNVNIGGSGKRVNMKSLKFVMTINMEDPICQTQLPTYNADGTSAGANTATLSNTVLLEDNNSIVIVSKDAVGNVVKTYTRTEMFAEFFKSLTRYFKDERYFRIDGKPLVVLQSAQRLYAADSNTIYAMLRQAVRDYAGEEMFMVAQQDAWSPPARYEAFFKNNVDAVTHRNMYNQGDFSRATMLHQFIFLNWEYSREWFRNNWNATDYIPTGGVAYNKYVDNGQFDAPVVNFDGDNFREMCNLMKSQSGNCRVMFFDSFNQIQYSSFLEPTKEDYGNGFGTRFLNIIREEFKR